MSETTLEAPKLKPMKRRPPGEMDDLFASRIVSAFAAAGFEISHRTAAAAYTNIIESVYPFGMMSDDAIVQTLKPYFVEVVKP